MAISKVRLNIEGTWHDLVYNSTSGKWEKTITAPTTTSFNKSGGYYALTVEATNTAQTVTTATTGDATVGNNLKLVVKETVAPITAITSPGAGAYLSNAKPVISFTLRDESNGSGINITTMRLRIDSGSELTSASAGMSVTQVTNGYDVTYAPQTALGDGSHTIYLNVKDNDGNTAAQKTVNFTIDTIPPVLNVTSPTANFITNNKNVNVTGTTSDETSGIATVKITLNGADQGAITVSGGAFSKAIVLNEGANTIVVKATNSAALETSVTITGTLDTSIPKITEVSVTPNPADAGASMVVNVTVS